MDVQTRALMGIGLLWALMGCTGPTMEAHERPTRDLVVDMLHQGILDLDANMGQLNRHIAELQDMPPVSDPTLQELRALDLSGWQLHQQQWLLQREHLSFAVNQLQRVQINPGLKPEIWTQWTTRQQQFVRALDDLRTQRHALERKRLEVETQMLERYFK